MFDINEQDTSATLTLDKISCRQAGYLPVPLRNVPPESLAELDIYLSSGSSYQLYRTPDLHFGPKDQQRLMESGVEFVYISIKDHQKYYRMIEESLEEIITDPRTKLQKKSQILYSTSMELASQMLQTPPGKQEIIRTGNIAQGVVKLIINNDNAFSQLFEVSNHDFYTATHMVNVCTSMVALAEKMGISDEQSLQRLGIGAMLHDIGKLFIPPEVLNMQKKLTKEEYSLLQSHVQKGCDHLEQLPDVHPESLAVVAQHHERMDGSGYPHNLKGEQISFMGRLAGIVDSFEAMTSVRPYRNFTYSITDALQQLDDNAPDKFDIEVVTAFNRMIENQLNLARKTADKQEPQENQEPEQNISGRRYNRYYFRMPASMRVINRTDKRLTFDKPQRIVVHNISRSGVGILTPQALEPGVNICITFMSVGLKKTTNLIAQVNRCEDYSNGWFTLGAHFHKTPPEQLIEDIKKVTVVRDMPFVP
ncbi:MAG: HD domain-containing protein [Sedimentisphaerales bacterium]|nr:HD domain-containing protein [Sedimentisphaerales bacterium]